MPNQVSANTGRFPHQSLNTNRHTLQTEHEVLREKEPDQELRHQLSFFSFPKFSTYGI
jgi:hypothetical protein